MDHVMGGGADGIIPGHEDKDEFGNRPNGIYVPRFRNIKTKEPFLRGYGYQGGAYREGWSRGINSTGFGADFKKAFASPARGISPFTVSANACPTATISLKSTKNRTTPGAFPL